MKLDDRATAARTELDDLLADVPVAPASRVRTVSRRRRTLRAAAGVLAVAAIALGVTVVVADDDTKEPLVLTPPDSTVSTVPAIQLGTRLELDTTTVAPGGSITGQLVVDNPSDVDIPSDLCGDNWTVALFPGGGVGVTGNEGCAAGEGAFAPGVTRIEFVIVARTSNDEGGKPLQPGDYMARFLYTGTMASIADSVPVTVAAPTVETTPTTISTEPPPSFPAARTDVQHGEPTWAVVLGGRSIGAGDDPYTYPEISTAVAAAEGAGYDTGPTDCDQGARQAVGGNFLGGATFMSVSVYFSSEADARLAADLFRANGHETAVVTQLTTFCLD